MEGIERVDLEVERLDSAQEYAGKCLDMSVTLPIEAFVENSRAINSIRAELELQLRITFMFTQSSSS